MKITTYTFSGPKESLLLLCDKANELTFAKASECKKSVLKGEKGSITTFLPEGYTDPNLFKLIEWLKENHKEVTLSEEIKEIFV